MAASPSFSAGWQSPPPTSSARRRSRHLFERLTQRAAELVKRASHVVLAGDYNVMPTEIDVYKPERWVDDALFRPETREKTSDHAPTWIELTK
jgi:exonuclease III